MDELILLIVDWVHLCTEQLAGRNVIWYSRDRSYAIMAGRKVVRKWREEKSLLDAENQARYDLYQNPKCKMPMPTASDHHGN